MAKPPHLIGLPSGRLFYQGLPSQRIRTVLAQLGLPSSKRMASIIKSIEIVAVTIPAGQNSFPQPLKLRVNPRRSIFLSGYLRSDDTRTSEQDPENQIAPQISASGDSLIASTNTVNTTYARTIYGTVIQFKSWAVLDVNHYFVKTPGGTQNADMPVTPTPAASSAVLLNGIMSSDTNNSVYYSSRAYVSPNVDVNNMITSVHMGRNNANGDLTSSFSVIRFNPAIIRSIQSVVTSVTLGTGTTNVTLPTPVTMANCFNLSGGWRDGSGFALGDGNSMPLWYLSAPNTVTTTIQDTTFQAPVTSLTIVEFVKGIVRNKAYFNPATILTGTGSLDTVVPVTDQRKAAVAHIQATYNDNDAIWQNRGIATIFVPPNIVRLQRGIANAFIATVSSEYTEFY